MPQVKEVQDQSCHIPFEFFAAQANYRRDSGGGDFFC
jgi:hypothetical protein